MVALSAEETAGTLELSVAAVNRLLQRARETLAGTTAALAAGRDRGPPRTGR